MKKNKKKRERWTVSPHSVYNIGYHLIWCPKYRRKVLINGVDERLKQLLQIKASALDAYIEIIEIMPDHVHVFIKCKPNHSPHYIVQQFKGNSSKILRDEFPFLKKRLPSLWTRSYFCESVGHLSEDTIKKYIADQKSK